MTDSGRSLHAGDGASRKAGSEEDRGVPRWVKMFGLAVAGLLISAVVVMLLSGGQHGPGRHLSTLGAAVPSSHIAKLEQPRVGDST